MSSKQRVIMFADEEVTYPANLFSEYPTIQLIFVALVFSAFSPAEQRLLNSDFFSCCLTCFLCRLRLYLLHWGQQQGDKTAVCQSGTAWFITVACFFFLEKPVKGHRAEEKLNAPTVDRRNINARVKTIYFLKKIHQSADSFLQLIQNSSTFRYVYLSLRVCVWGGGTVCRNGLLNLQNVCKK